MARVRQWPGMGQAVGRGRAFVEDERRGAGPGGQRLLVDLPLLPEADDLLFLLGEGNGAFDGVERVARVRAQDPFPGCKVGKLHFQFLGLVGFPVM